MKKVFFLRIISLLKSLDCVSSTLLGLWYILREVHCLSASKRHHQAKSHYSQNFGNRGVKSKIQCTYQVLLIRSFIYEQNKRMNEQVNLEIYAYHNADDDARVSILCRGPLFKPSETSLHKIHHEI
jgi:hypothetical protein